ncbi:MAG: SCO family protein [Sphingomonas bacterium]|nr:SCO family protein [Sphingomonas bacterium]
MSMIVLGSAYTGDPTETAHQGHGNHDSYAPPVSPDKLGGSYEFLDLKNRRVTAADFKGQWTLLFFGYARCKGSCPTATPKIVKAARMLRDQGVKARAVFVDIEAPPQQMISRVNGATVPLGGHGHGHMNQIAAMRGLAGTWGGDLTVLTGTRLQLSNAARAFMVTREHKPPRKGEEGHSINHSSRIYFVAPDTKVAGYGHHDADPAELVATVARLSKKGRSG